MVNGYLSGADAIDLARMTGLDLHRAPVKPGGTPDTSWQQADKLVAEGVDPGDFYMDLDRMPPEELAHALLSTIGIMKALP